MLFYISSTNPSDYSTVKFSTSALTGKNNLEFRINQLATFASFLITTNDDYITFEFDDNDNNEVMTFNFTDKSFYDKDTLPQYLESLIYNNKSQLRVTYNELGTLTISRESPSGSGTECQTGLFRIKDASHRVKLLTGLYYSSLPSSFTKSYIIESIPYTCYGNNLYLKSKISNIVGFNNEMNEEIYISVCYHVFEMLYPGVPIISRTPGNYVKIKPTDLSNLEFSLVDFQNEPVVLKSPLNLVLECRENINLSPN